MPQLCHGFDIIKSSQENNPSAAARAKFQKFMVSAMVRQAHLNFEQEEAEVAENC